MHQTSKGKFSQRTRARARRASLPVVAACSAAVALGALARAPAAPGAEHQAAQGTPGSQLLGGPPTTLPYRREYPVLHYERTPQDNPVARLQARLDRGEARLAFHAPRGYLDALLAALAIDKSSQTLVYSKTSLQVGRINAATPRAIYFDDDTYVAWVQGGENLEIAAMDTKLGQVFYVLPNRAGGAPRLHRETLECLACHDTYELSGGGVPRFLLMSTYVDVHGNQLTHEGQIITSDQTELKYRWGGWYVTGRSGNQVHLGNIQVHDVQELVHLDRVRRGNLDTLQGLFDTRPYLTDKSDIVALLVLQHQVDVQNLITRVNFEVRTALAKGPLAEKTRAELKEYLDALVNAMLFVDATRFTSKITGNSGFDRWFEARGPRDRLGRSLRDLDLSTRLFKYPLSYLVYSAAFDGLPDYAKHYVYGRFADILSGRDAGAPYAQLTPGDRTAIREILAATKPDFAQFVASHGPA
ncbi:MAG TPA: hypothetical protein VMD03_03485 [Steroidobacteraceae bacterium]|nr:hypothetical protein [Steroidobacteraceae bacterium]